MWSFPSIQTIGIANGIRFLLIFLQVFDLYDLQVNSFCNIINIVISSVNTVTKKIKEWFKKKV